MKKLFFCMFAAALVVLASCSRTGDDILKTVPKDTKGMVLLNLKGVNDHLKSDGDDNLQELITTTFGKDMDKEAKYFLSEDSPVDFNAPAVIFEKDEEPYFSFYVKDEKAFREALEDECSMKLKEKDGVYRNTDDGYNRVFQIGKQVWLTEDRNVTVKEIKKLADLEEKKSVLGLEGVEDLFKKENDISGFANISEISKADIGYDGQQMMLVLNAAFDDPKFVTFNANFETGKAIASMTVLNGKGEPSKCVFAPTDINMAELEAFPLKGDLFFSAGIDADYINDMLKKYAGLGIPKDVTQVLGSLEGNITGSLDIASLIEYINRSSYSYYDEPYYDPYESVYSEDLDAFELLEDTIVDEDYYYPQQNSFKPMQKTWNYAKFALEVSFKNATSAHTALGLLEDLRREGLNIETNSNKLIIKGGNPNGSSISAVADMFDGASAGLAVITKNISDPKVKFISDDIPSASLMWKPEDGSLKLDLTINTKEDKNSLATFFKVLNLASKARY